MATSVAEWQMVMILILLVIRCKSRCFLPADSCCPLAKIFLPPF